MLAKERRSVRYILGTLGLALISVAALFNLVAVAQDDDARLLEVIAAAPSLRLQRSEFVLEPSLAATSATVGRPVSSVAVDPRGYVYVIQRGVPKPIVVADPTGKVVAAWGEGLFKIPHTIRVDPDGNVWTVDAESSMIYKFTSQGRKLLEISVGGQPTVAPPRRNVPGTSAPLVGQFWGTTDVAFSNGHIYVSDGYANNRILEYDAIGRRLREWGVKGRGPGEFDLPHAIAVASNGDLYVADRENGRIQWFTATGRYLGKWDYGGRVFSLVFGQQNDLYFTVRAKQAPSDAEGWLVRVDAKTGRVLGWIDAPVHSISLAWDGSLFVGTGAGTVLKFKSGN
jgi:DNA-binding beta-propeller fold protein YncE